MKNYLDLGPCRLGMRKLMVYLDNDECYGFGPIVKHGARVKLKQIMSRDGDKYKLVFVHIRKEDESKFIEAMEDLEKKMLICGHTDYEAYAVEIIGDLEEKLGIKAG